VSARNIRLYRYVGPEEIRLAAVGCGEGTAIANVGELQRWFVAHEDEVTEGRVWATYVVDEGGALRLAARRSEHVACAGGGRVRAAGEVSFTERGVICELTNYSTGYCPDVSCWDAVEASLRLIGAEYPNEFTFVAIFRRCAGCGERNLVKDGWFFCAICDSELPPAWNFGT
jgi:hypothetical protein